MRIDLHCHTNRYSACSALSPDELAAAARTAGLDGVCFTEHERTWPRDELRALGRRHGLVVLGGVEVTTEVGHVLVFGLDELPPAAFVAESLVAAVRAVGALAVLAHPARAGQPIVPAALRRRLFDAVETHNGSDSHEQTTAAGGLVDGMALPGIGGSDCHAAHEVGRAWTVLPHPVRDERGLVAALRLGRHRAERATHG